VITQGLNTRGGVLTQGLEHDSTALLTLLVELAEVQLYAYDVTTVQFYPTGPGYARELSSFHCPDDERPISAQHLATGENPQADPPRAARLDEWAPQPDASGEVSAQHTITGEAPQADPPQTFRADESSSPATPPGAEGAQHVATGLDPQPDPDAAFRPKESGSEEDDC